MRGEEKQHRDRRQRRLHKMMGVVRKKRSKGKEREAKKKK